MCVYVCVCVCVLTKLKTIIKSIYPYSLKNMIDFNVAIVGYWVAHRNRYQGSGEVGSYSKGSILLSLGFPSVKYAQCLLWLTLHKERRKIPDFWNCNSPERSFCPFWWENRGKSGLKTFSRANIKGHIEPLYLHLALTVQKASVFIFIIPVHPVQTHYNSMSLMSHLHYNNIFLGQKSPVGTENVCFLSGINPHLHKSSNNFIISSSHLVFSDSSQNLWVYIYIYIL